MSEAPAITKQKEPVFYEPGDEERMSHYVTKAELAAATFEGRPCRALCGKVWLPSKDPERFPVCPECKEIFDQLPG